MDCPQVCILRRGQPSKAPGLGACYQATLAPLGNIRQQAQPAATPPLAWQRTDLPGAALQRQRGHPDVFWVFSH